MNTYKLHEEELLASFRPDTTQNRQPSPVPPQQQPYPPQQQLQKLQQIQSNQSFPPMASAQGQNIAFGLLEQGRDGGVLVEKGVPTRRNSPAIMISYNEMQRGVSPQQGSIVTQVYKPIPQQPPQGIEQKPQSNMGKAAYVALPQQLPQQQIVVQQQQAPPPQQIPQQQAGNTLNIGQIQQRSTQQGAQIAVPPLNQTVVYHNPQVVHRAPVQQVVDQHGQVHYIQQNQNLPYGQVIIGSQSPPPGYHFPQQIVHQVPQQYPPPSYPPHRPYSEPAEQQQKQPIPLTPQIPQAQQIPQNHPQPTQPPQPIQNQQNAGPRVQKQYAQYQGQPYPPQQYPPEYYQQGYFQGQEGGQYEQYYEQQGYAQYPPQYYQQQGYEQYPPKYYQQQEAQSSLWQQRFFYLYQRYQTFLSKYEGATKDAGFLTEQFLTVDNEEDWVALKEKYDLLVEHMVETRDENAQILQEMQENIQQNQKIESNQIKEEAGRVWEHRYLKLLEEYESLSHHYAELQSSSIAQNDVDDNERIAMMNEKYARLEAEYNHVVQQLQESPASMQTRQEHEDLLKYTQQLQGYIQQLENENNTLMKGMKTSVEGSKMLDQTELNQKVADKDSEIHNLTKMVVSLQQKLKQGGQVRPKSNISKDLHTSQLENQLQEMNHYCAEIQQKLTMKEYEINGLKDKIGYLEQQLHLKNEQIANNSKLLKEQLQRIQTEIASKSNQNIPSQAPTVVHSYSRIEEDYEARIKDYQKAIQTKNGEIRVLEDRIYECESDARKINFDKSAQLREWQERIDQLSEQFRTKIAEKDVKVKQLEATIAEREEEGQRRAQEKDQTVRAFQVELSKLKEETEGRLVERDLLIKGLKEAGMRLEGQIRDRNSQLSRMRSPNLTPMMRSPNQSFVVQNIRYEQELKLLSEQLQRRNDELGKLKKERQQRNKQYRDLEIEYQNLQQENNKRRIEINNLRRQNTTIQNLELETENLRSTITKRNNEISELKNALFQADRLRMELDSRGREVERLAQLSRMKAKEIEHLSERNYELQEKLRKQEFKLTALPTRNEPVTRGAQEEVLRVQEELRKREIELNRYRLQSEETSRSLKRDREELETLKQKYPSRLRQVEQQLAEAKLKLSSLEKKSSLLENKNREMEELIRSLRSSAVEDARGEASILKQYYSKFIERQEEELKQLKERTRSYQLRIHEYQQEVDQLSAKNKEAEAFRGDHARKLKALSDKLQSKQQELRAFKLKQNSQLSILRKKEQRLVQAQALAKSRQNQIHELQRRIQSQKSSYKSLKKQFDDYKHRSVQRMEVSTHKEMENLNKQIADYESKVVFQVHNFDFRTKDKKANQIFERRVIYQLKEENEFLRRQLEGKGVNISLQKMKINQMQQEALMKSKKLLRDDHSNSEELAFYKDKNKQLEERVNSHIAVNKNLRERLEYLLEEGKYEESDKLKLRLIQLENKEKQYQQKLERLLEQNRNIKRQNNSLSISTAQEYEIKLQEFNRRLTQMTLERNTFHQQITVIRVQRENLEGQCKELQKQLTKLSNQNGVLKSQIERLNQTKNSNNEAKNGSSDQLQRQIRELTIDLASKNEQLQRSTVQFDNLKHQIHKLQVELANTKQQLISSNQSYIQIEHWKRTALELQSEIAHFRDEIQQIKQQCEYYKSQANNKSDLSTSFYYIQLLRSNAVEVESLASEVGLQNQRVALLVQRLGENSKRSLESCQYLYELLS